MLVDVANLATDGINGITQFILSSLILLDYRLTLKRGIHTSIGCFVDVRTQFIQLGYTIDDALLGIPLLNVLFDFVHHFIKVGLVLVILISFNHKKCRIISGGNRCV